MPSRTPRETVNAQLVAYNNHDIDGYMATFSDDAVISDLASGTEIARGAEVIRKLYSARFADNPKLHCTVFSRTDLANFALDREEVTGLATGPLQIIAIYEVIDGKIRTLRFIRESGPCRD